MMLFARMHLAFCGVVAMVCTFPLAAIADSSAGRMIRPKDRHKGRLQTALQVDAAGQVSNFQVDDELLEIGRQKHKQTPVTCQFKVWNNIRGAYYNGNQLKLTDAGNWARNITFVPVEGAFLTILGSGSARCPDTGIKIRCFGDSVLDANIPKRWQAFGSNNSLSNLTMKGRGMGWTSPSAGGAIDANKVYPVSLCFRKLNFVFRWQTPFSHEVCNLSASSALTSVVYNNVYLFANPFTQYGFPSINKQIKFPLTPGAMLVVGGQASSVPSSCNDNVMGIVCSGADLGANSIYNWKSYGSSSICADSHLSGWQGNWSASCPSASSALTSLPAAAVKMWTNPPKQYSLFKWTSAGETFNCSIYMDNWIYSVFYNGMNITDTLVGNLRSVGVIKKFNLSLIPGAVLALSVGDQESGGCNTGGFMMACDSLTGTSEGHSLTMNDFTHWSVYSSNTSIQNTRILNGYGNSSDGWTEPMNSVKQPSLLGTSSKPPFVGNTNLKLCTRSRFNVYRWQTPGGGHKSEPIVSGKPVVPQSPNCGFGLKGACTSTLQQLESILPKIDSTFQVNTMPFFKYFVMKLNYLKLNDAACIGDFAGPFFRGVDAVPYKSPVNSFQDMTYLSKLPIPARADSWGVFGIAWNSNIAVSSNITTCSVDITGYTTHLGFAYNSCGSGVNFALSFNPSFMTCFGGFNPDVEPVLTLKTMDEFSIGFSLDRALGKTYTIIVGDGTQADIHQVFFSMHFYLSATFSLNLTAILGLTKPNFLTSAASATLTGQRGISFDGMTSQGISNLQSLSMTSVANIAGMMAGFALCDYVAPALLITEAAKLKLPTVIQNVVGLCSSMTEVQSVTGTVTLGLDSLSGGMLPAIRLAVVGATWVIKTSPAVQGAADSTALHPGFYAWITSSEMDLSELAQVLMSHFEAIWQALNIPVSSFDLGDALSAGFGFYVNSLGAGFYAAGTIGNWKSYLTCSYSFSSNKMSCSTGAPGLVEVLSDGVNWVINTVENGVTTLYAKFSQTATADGQRFAATVVNEAKDAAAKAANAAENIADKVASGIESIFEDSGRRRWNPFR